MPLFSFLHVKRNYTKCYADYELPLKLSSRMWNVLFINCSSESCDSVKV